MLGVPGLEPGVAEGTLGVGVWLEWWCYQWHCKSILTCWGCRYWCGADECLDGFLFTALLFAALEVLGNLMLVLDFLMLFPFFDGGSITKAVQVSFHQ